MKRQFIDLLAFDRRMADDSHSFKRNVNQLAELSTRELRIDIEREVEILSRKTAAIIAD